MRRSTVTVREYTEGELAREVITEVTEDEDTDPGPEPVSPLEWWNPAAWYPAILT